MFTRMTIGEAIAEEQLKKLVKIASEELEAVVQAEIGCRDGRILTEDNGSMIVIEMDFDTREIALRYGSSRGYRNLVADSAHLLAGDFVIKFFERVETQITRGTRMIETKGNDND